jgi:Tfp pilus assembly protein PilO
MKGRAPLIAAGAGILVAILIVLTLILPTSHKITEKKGEITTAEQMENTLTLQLQTLKGDEDQAAANKQKLSHLAAKLPPTADLPGLIRLLDTAAGVAGVDFMSLAPATPTTSPEGSASVVPVSITVEGGFFAVEQYLLQLEGLTRAVKVLSVNVSQGGMANLLTVTISANFFTTDLSTGPGAAPGSGAGAPPAPGTSPSPSPTPTPPTSPTPSGSQSP